MTTAQDGLQTSQQTVCSLYGVGDWRGTGQTKVAMRHGDTRCVHGPKHHLRVRGVGGSWLLSLVILNPGWSEGPMWALDGSPVACYFFFFLKG